MGKLLCSIDCFIFAICHLFKWEVLLLSCPCFSILYWMCWREGQISWLLTHRSMEKKQCLKEEKYIDHEEIHDIKLHAAIGWYFRLPDLGIVWLCSLWIEKIEGIINDLITLEMVSAYPVPTWFSTFPNFPSYVMPEFKLYPECYKNP